MTPDFRPFAKIPRFNREVIVTEKLDGTNASILITPDGELFTGSRNRWITPKDDNAGFAAWANAHRDELLTGLGEGHHFGEWWGQGIQRRYDLTEKRFSLFNTSRWTNDNKPACCHIVPELWRGMMVDLNAPEILAELGRTGSVAASGFMRPEGIIVFHTAASQCFKMTFDDSHKG